MKHVRTFHSLSSLLLKQQSNVYNKPLCEKRSEMLRFSRLPQEAATELPKPVVVRWNAMDPPTISIHCAAPPPTNTRTRVARSPHVDRAFLWS